MSECLIACRGLYKSYGLRLALSGVDLEVGPGRIVGLLGPNGSGKTTLIKLLCGLLQPTTGRLAVDGAPIGPCTKSVVSYLPDRMYFANWMRAVDLFDLFRDFYADFDYEKALSMCRSLGVEPRDRLKSMSKGTKEKVQLVLVMARAAKLYLLDEPFAGLDLPRALRILERLRTLPAPVLLVSHEPNLLARADTVIELDGPPLQFRSHHV